MRLAYLLRRANDGVVLLALFALIPFGVGQSAAPNATSTTAAKPLAFEVVSIRPSKPGTHHQATWGIKPDGYRISGQTVRDTLMLAYFPQGLAYWSGDRLAEGPSWLNDQYDIVAKVPEDNIADWQKQGFTLDKKPMLRQMLQTMLADRFHLVAHMVAGPPFSGWSLEVGKHGPRLTEPKPDAILPTGAKLPDGGIAVPFRPGESAHVSFYSATMADFAYHMSLLSGGHPIQDHTGISGHYDFILDWKQDPDSNLPPGAVAAHDPDPLSHWDVAALGLRLVPAKLPAETLVIDHIEKPSEN